MIPSGGSPPCRASRATVPGSISSSDSQKLSMFGVAPQLPALARRQLQLVAKGRVVRRFPAASNRAIDCDAGCMRPGRRGAIRKAWSPRGRWLPPCPQARRPDRILCAAPSMFQPSSLVVPWNRSSSFKSRSTRESVRAKAVPLRFGWVLSDRTARRRTRFAVDEAERLPPTPIDRCGIDTGASR